MGTRYRWLRAGDLNAFFGLALDNLSNLVILWGLLVASSASRPSWCCTR